jgi:hypothetical protein
MSARTAVAPSLHRPKRTPSAEPGDPRSPRTGRRTGAVAQLLTACPRMAAQRRALAGLRAQRPAPRQRGRCCGRINNRRVADISRRSAHDAVHSPVAGVKLAPAANSVSVHRAERARRGPIRPSMRARFSSAEPGDEAVAPFDCKQNMAISMPREFAPTVNLGSTI